MKLSFKPENHSSNLKPKCYFSTNGGHRVDITSDYIFKGIFNDAGRLSDFLKSILVGKDKVLPEDTKFEDIQFIKNEYIQNLEPGQAKKTIFDIQVQTNSGRFIIEIQKFSTPDIIEIQKFSTPEYLKRMEFYAALAYSHQEVKDPKTPSMKDYENALPIVVVSVITDTLLPADVPCVSYHINFETKTKKSFMNSLTYVFIELGKFGNTEYDQSPIDNIDEREWLELMKTQDITRDYTNKQVDSAKKYVNHVANDKYEEYVRAQMAEDIEKKLFDDAKRMGRKEGRNEGRNEGRKEGRKEVARKLLKAKNSIEEVMEFTNLTREEIQEIIAQTKDK